MRYLVIVKPLEPFFFGGDRTFGALRDMTENEVNAKYASGDRTFGALGEENSNYLVHSRPFPQQTALLGIIRKEILIQKGLLTKKRRGEWIDDYNKSKAKNLVGDTKFAFNKEQNFGVLNNISPIFLIKNGERFIKKADIDSYPYQDGVLKNYNPKEDIYNNFISIESNNSLKFDNIFKPVEQIGIKKGGGDNAFFKKTSYLLKDNFSFAFYMESDFELKSSYVTLGAETSMFKMEITPSSDKLDYQDKNGYLTLLSDAYIDISIKEHCTFAITSEISFRYLENEFNGQHRKFKKSKNIFLYEKGSVFIKPSQELINNLNNQNLQKIGLNIYTIGEKQ